MLNKDILQIHDSISELQKTNFYFDDSINCAGINYINLKKYSKCILICDEDLIRNNILLNIKNIIPI